MADIKAGDIVECLEDYEGQFTKGKLYTVKKFFMDGVIPWINVVEDDLGSSTNGWAASRFRLAMAKASKPPKARRLTAQGEKIKSEWEHLYKAQGCKCSSGYTCPHCSHPGHPYSLENNSALWEDVPEKTKAELIWEAIREAAGKGNT